MITAILFNQPIIVTQEYKNYCEPTKCNLQKLTRLKIMQEFLPTGMLQKQQKYYVYIRSRKLGITWGTKLCKKLLKLHIHYE